MHQCIVCYKLQVLQYAFICLHIWDNTNHNRVECSFVSRYHNRRLWRQELLYNWEYALFMTLEVQSLDPPPAEHAYTYACMLAQTYICAHAHAQMATRQFLLEILVAEVTKFQSILGSQVTRCVFLGQKDKKQQFCCVFSSILCICASIV